MGQVREPRTHPYGHRNRRQRTADLSLPARGGASPTCIAHHVAHAPKQSGCACKKKKHLLPSKCRVARPSRASTSDANHAAGKFRTFLPYMPTSTSARAHVSARLPPASPPPAPKALRHSDTNATAELLCALAPVPCCPHPLPPLTHAPALPPRDPVDCAPESGAGCGLSPPLMTIVLLSGP